MDEGDWKGWKILTDLLGDKCQLVGDVSLANRDSGNNPLVINLTQAQIDQKDRATTGINAITQRIFGPPTIDLFAGIKKRADRCFDLSASGCRIGIFQTGNQILQFAEYIHSAIGTKYFTAIRFKGDIHVVTHHKPHLPIIAIIAAIRCKGRCIGGMTGKDIIIVKF